ncbi:DUF418 domain-containing protein [Streptomyces sioyaensis]|uniref:DUF418 domain-containing protein n=1 Tax=Streptomyces sioyaensis TaxID=67364 RepID=UPI0033F2C567
MSGTAAQARTPRETHADGDDATDRTAPKGRMLGVDVLRALAILGMVWLHFTLTGWGNPAPAGQSADSTVTWMNDLLSTRSREIFFLLAGVTVALLTGGTSVRRGRERVIAWKRIAIRAGTLFVLALVLGELGEWESQILHYYALWLLLLLPLSMLRVRTLLIIAGVLAVACPAFKIVADHAGTSWGFLPITAPGVMPKEPAGGFALLIHPGDWLPTLQNVFFGMGNFGQDTISVLPFLILGLALGKLDLRKAAVRRRMVVAGAGTAVAALLLSLVSMYPLGAVDKVNAYKNPPAAATAAPAAAAGAPSAPPKKPEAPWESLVTMGHPGPAEKQFSATEGVFMLGTITALLGGLLTLMDKRLWRRLLRPLAAFGSMALTWYFGHFLWLTYLAPVSGPEGQPAGRAVLSFAVFVVVSLTVSLLWRKWLRRGPLEWLVHQAVTIAVPGSNRRRRPVSS